MNETQEDQLAQCPEWVAPKIKKLEEENERIKSSVDQLKGEIEKIIEKNLTVTDKYNREIEVLKDKIVYLVTTGKGKDELKRMEDEILRKDAEFEKLQKELYRLEAKT
eukprot:TRINITY_DN14076_c0_g1_i1.p1 TRINITY_DN14076_c0_g1~~TRINITY_DN14076_c0_g1_i1.p1  ORF type:complete len:108 (-),score=38.25 TRINITY_DN14076_c0_g1_i1:93-416(-)